MSKPTHYAYVVSTPKKDGDKGIWTRVGAVWPHKNGKGFDLVIAEGLSVSGRIVCTEYKDKEAGEQFEAAVHAQIQEMSTQRNKFDE